MLLPFMRTALKIIWLCLFQQEKYVRLCTPLPVRLLRRCTKSPWVCSRCRHQISKTNLRSIARPVDIHIEVPRVDYEKLSGDRMRETGESVRARVQAARNVQQKRFSNIRSSDIVCNTEMRVGQIRQFCKLQDDGQSLMRAAMTQLINFRTFA